MKNAVLSRKPYAGNPHVRFDEGEVASGKPRRGFLLYKAGCLLGAVLFLCTVFAAPSTRIALPLSDFSDTEVTTNLAFTAWEPRQRQFVYELAFDATPSNNFEVAFGRDVDANGILSRGEAVSNVK